MGLYINPNNMSKEQWLNQNGTPIAGKAEWNPESGNLPVCLVDNGMFTAAGICFSYGELQAFSSPKDARPKKWYSVGVDKLDAVTEGALGNYLNNNQKADKK